MRMTEYKPEKLWNNIKTKWTDLNPPTFEYVIGNAFPDNDFQDDLKQLLWEIASRTFYLEGRTHALQREIDELRDSCQKASKNE